MNWWRKLFSRRFTPEPERLPWDGPVQRTLHVHPSVLKLTAQAFARTAATGYECGLFWYGAKLSPMQETVLAIVVPEQTDRPGNYFVSGAAMEEVSDRTRDQGWRNLAQVHTHPTTWVGHSPYDDLRANSRHALSLVWPNYGAPVDNWARNLGVHEFLDGRWQQLSVRCCKLRIRLSEDMPKPVLLDLRRKK